MRALHAKAAMLGGLAAELCVGARERGWFAVLAAAHSLSAQHAGQVCVLSGAHEVRSTPTALRAMPPSNNASLLPVAGRLRVSRRLCASGNLDGAPWRPWLEAAEFAARVCRVR